jgi:hypothetical protein
MSHLGNLSITLINATQYASIATSEQTSQGVINNNNLKGFA